MPQPKAVLETKWRLIPQSMNIPAASATGTSRMISCAQNRVSGKHVYHVRACCPMQTMFHLWYMYDQKTMDSSGQGALQDRPKVHPIFLIRAVLIEQLFPTTFFSSRFSSFFFSEKNRKSRKHRKHFQSWEIEQRAKYLERFAFQHLEKEIGNMEIFRSTKNCAGKKICSFRQKKVLR